MGLLDLTNIEKANFALKQLNNFKLDKVHTFKCIFLSDFELLE